ncbi:hypothetical protein RF11_09317 [Thelohanellus kitauei]|uniref:Homeobox protein SIX1 N-terminal SD domain-containing protein n=1 Tax=Thelohanellus kitauei TaxID=669202 RepID=A0A0C2MKI0_THEKT|nr:hypothetical protein RF11_09317 [Thelohanellus kitauei]
MFVTTQGQVETLSNYDQGHLICICNHLLAKEDFKTLNTFLSSMSIVNQTPELSEHLKMVRIVLIQGWAFLYAYTSEYDKTFEIIKNNSFSASLRKKLQVRLIFD